MLRGGSKLSQLFDFSVIPTCLLDFLRFKYVWGWAGLMSVDSEQDARIALLEHYTSQMQGYKVSLLTIVIGFLAYVELITRIPRFYFGFLSLFLLPIGVGVLAGLGFWCVARIFWFGKHVRDIIRKPLGFSPSNSWLDKLDLEIHKGWSEREDYDPKTLTGKIIKIGGNADLLLLSAVVIGLVIMLVLLVLELWFRCAHSMWG
jgi:putative effector of murein hydrolase LrgA (UPF0299 family)